MGECDIYLKTVSDVFNFSHDVRRFHEDVDACHDRHVVDAKSFLGLLSISHSHIKVKIHTYDIGVIEDFFEFCKKYKSKTDELLPNTEE